MKNSNRIDIMGYEFDSNHIAEVIKHEVTAAEAQGYVDNALFSLARYGGRYECYLSSDGAAYIDEVDKKIKTAFKRKQNDDRKMKFIKEVESIEE